MKIFTNYLLLPISLLLILVISIICVKHELSESNDMINSLNNTIDIYKDKDSINHAKIQIIESNNIQSFTQLKTKDSVIIELQKLVKEYKNNIKNKGNITLLKTNTNIKNTSKSNVIQKDTVFVQDTVYLYPEYKSEYNSKWLLGNVIANKDSTKLNLKVINDFNIIQGETNSTFTKKTYQLHIINKNPYTTTIDARTYSVSTPIKRFSIGPNITYGLNSDGKLVFIGGIGLQYNLIQF